MTRLAMRGGLVLAAIGLVAGCYLPSDRSNRIRTAIYVDDGARNTGVYRLLEAATFSEELEAIPVDAAMIRAGVLDDVDVLVMPGGGANVQASKLGADGRRKITEFVRGGGGYLGLCAGCFLALEPATTHPETLGLIPYQSSGPHGTASLAVRFNSRASELLGIEPAVKELRYADGPVMKPAIPVADAEFEIVATYDSDINPLGEPSRESFAGQAAIVAGTCGKGRVVACAVHPEYSWEGVPVLRGFFRYLTGREVSWQLPQRRIGQLTVGFWTPKSFGVQTAAKLCEMLREHEFDLQPVNAESVRSYALAHVDVLVNPSGDDVDFNGPVIMDMDKAPDMLREIASRPQDDIGRFVLPPFGGRRVRTAVFADNGGGDYYICARLSRSRAFDVKAVSGAQIAAGVLKDFDLVIMPGGGCRTECKSLGEKGCAELVRFIREGGRYYGVCAGAFLASQVIHADFPRLGFVPYKDEDEPVYRGGCLARMKVTEAGRKVFRDSEELRTVFYNGGPVFVPGDPLPDADVQVLMTYDCENISTKSPDRVMNMRGKGAFLGGRVGKGRVFISGPHPEGDREADDLVDDGIEFLTGIRPQPVAYMRWPGALTVRFRYKQDRDAVDFYLNRLLPDRAIDVRTGGKGLSLKNTDVCIVTDIKESDFGDDLREFANGGGCVLALADTDERRAMLENFDWVRPVGSYDELAWQLDAMKVRRGSDSGAAVGDLEQLIGY